MPVCTFYLSFQHETLGAVGKPIAPEVDCWNTVDTSDSATAQIRVSRLEERKDEENGNFGSIGADARGGGDDWMQSRKSATG